MTTSLPWQQQFTYRKLGYLFFQDSLAYREVLDQNSQWEVTKLPPIGAQLEISGAPPTGGLTQGPYISGLATGTTQADIFPYETAVDYEEALSRYNLQGVVFRESLNGFSVDSAQAITGRKAG